MQRFPRIRTNRVIPMLGDFHSHTMTSPKVVALVQAMDSRAKLIHETGDYWAFIRGDDTFMFVTRTGAILTRAGQVPASWVAQVCARLPSVA